MPASFHSSDSGSYSTSSRCRSSGHTAKTAFTTLSSQRPACKHWKTSPAALLRQHTDAISSSDSKNSVQTYATTILSDDCLVWTEPNAPAERFECGILDVVATTPSQFSQLFPSTRRLQIQHDATTIDGNMNLRIDTEIITPHGEYGQMSLFHLRMYNLKDRCFSLRRYARDSGREVCSSKRKYVKPTPRKAPRPSKSWLRRSITTALHTLRSLSRNQSAGSRSVEETSDEEDCLRCFTTQAEVEATIATNTIRLEFSNYAQVEVRPLKRGFVKFFDFEYWGTPYTWRREVHHESGESYFSLHLHQRLSGARVAQIIPDKLDEDEALLEGAQGAWVPASSMRLLSAGITPDLGDVIMATGLISLTDNCIRHRRKLHSKSVDSQPDKTRFTEF